MFKVLVLVAVAALVVAGGVAARPEIPRRTWDTNVTMRDGVDLHTRFVGPRDFEEQVADGKKFTVIMDRSPYGYTGLEWIADIYLPFNIVTVGQDMRGTGLSGGEFTIWHSDGNDSYDTWMYLQDQPWSNGVLYTFGASADALAAYETWWNQPDGWLQAQYQIWSTSVGYEVIYPQGAYRESLADVWIRSTVPDQADEDLEIVMENEYPNEWWDALNFTGKYDYVNCPVGFWAGWYDIFQVGNILAFEGFQYESDPSVQGDMLLFVDPLGHCQSAADYFKQNTIAGRSLVPVAQSLQIYGFRDVSRDFKAVTWYVMSSSDDVANYWTTADTFPAFTPVSYYLHGDGTLSKQVPTEDDGIAETTTYTYDPADPVPSNGGNNLEIPCGPLDQRDLEETRDDVITFTTAVLEDDLVLTGPINAILYVSSDAVDTDFHVHVTDVLPSGESRLLIDSGYRMRWREMGTEPVMMEDGVVYEIEISLWNTSYIFPAGNQVRIDVSSSNYPRFSVNPNNGRLLVDEDFTQNVTAHNTLHHAAGYQSRVDFPVVAREDLPELHVVKAFENNFPELDVDHVIETMSSYYDEAIHKQIRGQRVQPPQFVEA